MEPVKLPLAVAIQSRDDRSLKDSRIVNGFIEMMQEGPAAVKRPGLSLVFKATTGTGQGLTSYSNTLYSISGDTLNGNSTVSVSYSQTSATPGWTPRTGMMGVGFNGKLWAMGGLDGNGVAQKDIYYSLDGISWALAGNAAWPARSGGQLIVFNSTLWLFGGFNGSTYYGDCWSSTDGATWTQQNASAFPSRSYFGITISNNKLYIAGGDSGTGNYYNDIWSSSDGKNWSQVTSKAPWVGRAKLGFQYFNGKFRVLAGAMQPSMGNAGGDLWSSVDCITWTRDTANPFGQAATSIASQIALTSGGAYWFPPTVTFTGTATGHASIIIQDDDEDDDASPIYHVAIDSVGSGYTEAPSITFGYQSGFPASGYAFLAANGAAGDKRGTMIIAGNSLLFFGTQNGGVNTNATEVWQSFDGTTWTKLTPTPPFSPRDTTPFFYGNLWILSGVGGISGNQYYSDVWSSPLSSASTYALSPSVAGLPFRFNQTASSIAVPLLCFKSTRDAYTFNPATTTLTKVTNANYPSSTAPGFAYLDGFFFVMDPQGRIFNSAINDFTTWTALGYIAMTSEPSGGTGIAKYGQYIVGFGQWSMQFFYDASAPAPGSPLLPNDTLTTLVGCVDGNTIVEMTNTIIWMGQSKQDGRGVYMLENGAPKRVSTPFIDRYLEADGLANLRAFVTAQHGHSFYVLNLTTSNITLVYDITSGVWFFWTTNVAKNPTFITSLTSDAYGLATAVSSAHGLSDGDPFTISGSSVFGYNGTYNAFFVDQNTFKFQLPASLAANTGNAQLTTYTEGMFSAVASTQLNGDYYFLHPTDGSVLLFTAQNTSDQTTPINFVTRSDVWSGGNINYKTFPEVSLVSDVQNSSALIRYTNDDYNNWSPYRQVSLGLIRQHLTRNGRARRRAYEVRHTASTPFRGFYIQMNVEGGEY